MWETNAIGIKTPLYQPVYRFSYTGWSRAYNFDTLDEYVLSWIQRVLRLRHFFGMTVELPLLPLLI